MDINIKHIFKSDLDPNSTAWWSQDKIDKINYNFGLFTLGGPQGPLGKYGSNGVVGNTGDYGFEGPVGYQGAQGSYGIEGAEPWRKVDQEDIRYLMPKYNGAPANEWDVIRVVFSDEIVSFIDLDNDGQIDSGETVETYNSPIAVGDTITVFYTPDSTFNNIELVSSSGPNIIGKAVLDLWSDGAQDVFEIYADQEIKFGGGGARFNNYEGDETWLEVNSDFKSEVASTFNQDLQVGGKLSYQLGAQQGYILAADDSNGNLSWMSKLQVFDNMPIGSIVSIPAQFFNTDNFYLGESLGSAKSNQGALALKYGRGKETGNYDGWYLCHGMTWQNGTVSYDIPNLNAFTYQIDSNGANGQPAVSGGSNDIIILAGAKVHVNADYTGPSTYDADLTLTDADETVSILYQTNKTATTLDYYRSRNIHIIYLGVDDLTWGDDGIVINEDPGNGGSPF